MRPVGLVGACVVTVGLLGLAVLDLPHASPASPAPHVSTPTVRAPVRAWSTDEPTTTTSLPKITYVQLPTPVEALPVSVSAPTTVRVSEEFTVRVECAPSWAGGRSFIRLFATREPNPPNYLDATGFSPGYASPQVAAEGRVEATFRAAATPQSVYVFVSCSDIEWVSDALVDDGEGGYLVSYNYYPPERLVEVRIVADSGTAGTLPRSL